MDDTSNTEETIFYIFKSLKNTKKNEDCIIEKVDVALSLGSPPQLVVDS